MPGVTGYLFDDNGDGLVALWSDGGEAPNFKMALGKHPVEIDLFGHATPLVPVDGISTVQIGNTPILIDHVDAPLVELRASFAPGTPNVPAGTGIVRTSVHLENPYADPMEGKLRLTPPAGWTIDPSTVDVQLAPHASMDVPVTLRYPYSEFAGAKNIRGKLTADNLDQPLDIATQITVGSAIVDMTCLAQLMPNGDTVLEQMITNSSNAPLSAQAYAMIPDAARQERFILNLPPGQKIVKRFTFPKTGSMAGKSAVLGLRQTDGRILLVKSVPLQ